MSDTFIKPVNGAITSPFHDPERLPHIHEGIDIGCPDHSTVVASADGKVVFTGLWGNGGNTLMIDSKLDGTVVPFETRYMHLNSYLVNKGAEVKQGQPIALSGGAKGEAGAGNATAPHLHFELRRGIGVASIAVNPEDYFGVKSVATDNRSILGKTTDSIGSVVNAINPFSGITSFLTTTNNWKRIGLGAIGVGLIAIVLTKGLAQSDTLKSAVKFA